MDPASGNRRDQRQKGQSFSPAPEAKAQTDGKIPPKVQAAEEKVLLHKRQDSVPIFPLEKVYEPVM